MNPLTDNNTRYALLLETHDKLYELQREAAKAKREFSLAEMAMANYDMAYGGPIDEDAYDTLERYEEAVRLDRERVEDMNRDYEEAERVLSDLTKRLDEMRYLVHTIGYGLPTDRRCPALLAWWRARHQ